MDGDPEIYTLFQTCRSIMPVVLHSCPDQCEDDDVVKCCIANYVTRTTTFECDNSPGVELDLKYVDVKDCMCDPCG